jgi:hypothetical protein
MSLALNAAFRKYAAMQANLDSEEYNANKAATETKMKMDRNLKSGEKSLADTMASKGMTHSGVNLDKNVELKKAYGEDSAAADQAQATLLSNIAKKRLEAESEYNTAKAYDPIQQLFA